VCGPQLWRRRASAYCMHVRASAGTRVYLHLGGALMVQTCSLRVFRLDTTTPSRSLLPLYRSLLTLVGLFCVALTLLPLTMRLHASRAGKRYVSSKRKYMRLIPSLGCIAVFKTNESLVPSKVPVSKET
jgi:hypothetical protein